MGVCLLRSSLKDQILRFSLFYSAQDVKRCEKDLVEGKEDSRKWILIDKKRNKGEKERNDGCHNNMKQLK